TDTDYRGITDAAGNLEISNLLPGPYDVSGVDPRLAELGLAIDPLATFTAARDSTAHVTLRVSGDDFVADRCRADHVADVGDYVVLGRVVSPVGTPIKGARVSFSVTGTGPFEQTLGDRYVTGDDGLFSICTRRLAPEMKIRITATHATLLRSEVVHTVSGKLTTVVVRMTRDE